MLAITSLMASLIGLALAPQLARITFLPGPGIVPFVLVPASVGAYAATTDLLPVLDIALFGVIGLVMKRLNYSLPSAIVGFFLGGIADKNLYLRERIYGWRFLERPDALPPAPNRNSSAGPGNLARRPGGGRTLGRTVASCG